MDALRITARLSSRNAQLAGASFGCSVVDRKGGAFLIDWRIIHTMTVVGLSLITLACSVNAQDPLQVDFQKFVAAANVAGLSDIIRDPSITVIAPTDSAWNQLGISTFNALLNDEVALKRVVGCHVVLDAEWQVAVANIEKNREGAYSADTLGGCRLTANWDGSKVAISDSYGDKAPLLSQIIMGGYSGVDTVFFPQGTEIEGVIRSSRIFAGPTQFPPEEFAAYGLFALKSLALDSATKDRYMILCQAFVASVPHASELAPMPYSEQLATVWPVDDDQTARQINRLPKDQVCEKALASYDLVRSQQALKEAELTNADLSGDGPFLIAWAPSTMKGAPDAIVLVLDLSTAVNATQGTRYMDWWVDKIESDPKLWRSGFDMNLALLHVEGFLTLFGRALFGVFGG